MSLKISVITPTYNSSDYVECAIRTVLYQDYENFEHVIVDGTSIDGTVDVVKKYPHIKWISEPDSGQPEAMNKGFRLATGDIIVYLNADDYFLPGAFQSVVPYFEKGAKVVVGKIMIEKETAKSTISDPKVKHEEMLRHWKPDAFPHNPVGYFYLREVQEAVGGFNERMQDKHDLDFLLAASALFEFTKIDRLLGVYRVHQDTKTWREQRDRSYWTFESFRVIDRHLEKFPPDFVQRFNEDRRKGYAKMRKIQVWENIKLHLINRSHKAGFRSLVSKLIKRLLT
jgi:glycosyltransferase involved in cell wall biosynthesis